MDFNGEAVPFYAYGWEDEYLKISPIDRIIKMIYELQFGNKKSYESLTNDEKKQIMVIRFEDFVDNTYKIVDDLAVFLNTKTSKYTKRSIIKQGCPRIQNLEKRVERYKNIKKISSSPYIQLVEEMIEDYEVDWA